MVIAFRSRFSLDQFLLWSQFVVLAASLVTVLIFCVKMFDRQVLEVGRREAKVLSFAMDEILTGPLALRENSRSPLAIALEQKLVFLAQSLRPDVKREEMVFHIGVKGSDAQRVVREGEPIHCNLMEHESGGIEAVEFLEGDGNVTMVPHVLDARSLLLKVGRIAGEEMEVVLKARSDLCGKVVENAELGALGDAKWWGQDLFFRDYGGTVYRPMWEKQKVEVVCGKLRYVLYVGAGDFLSFQEGKWGVVGSIEAADRDAPLAYVKELSQKVLEIEAWDAEGFPLFHAKLEREGLSPVRFSAEAVIQGAKQRTSKQVSCKIGKKRFVLQPGDWVIQYGTGWRKLKTMSDIEMYLNHDLRGDLFVVDSIDTKGVVQGRFFNKMRTQMAPFTVRAISSKGNRKGKAK